MRKLKNKVENDDGGASAAISIKKTLTDIENILAGEELSPHYSAKLRIKLRSALVEAFEAVGQSWYRKGFNRGHLEAYEQALEDGVVPKELRAVKKRQFTRSSISRKIKLKSVIKSSKS
ncbi:hypothetical protein SJI00_20740 [Pseudomonas sp. RP23018S]|uniref:hypothetical protein n=1 Tax=Pseudomonas sp. RP23018S TaxID=3096037 RepID=UPI002ACAD3C7|nr:hypothetical protein [Pseudomonas sp. RP23018S]MDZ5605203.1 hypothetical protein [Pseudomonas sp. RP23018S]